MPWAPAAKPAAAPGQLLCEPRETETPLKLPVAKPSVAVQCRNCGTEETPQWHQGLDGHRTLCNACGLRYRAGKLVPEHRPPNTFCPDLHFSNIRRHVAEMCRRHEE